MDIHVYATDKETAVAEAFDTYIHARDMAESREIPIAPIEIKGGCYQEMKTKLKRIQCPKKITANFRKWVMLATPFNDVITLLLQNMEARKK